MANSSTKNATPYNELIPTPGDFTGEKFRDVLQSHGLTVISNENDTRQIKLDAHGEYPDMYIDVPFAGHNFDKYVFSEASGIYATASIPNRPIEQRLQYLNSILVNSGYVGEKITLDMLNSPEPLNLAPGSKALKELESYKENKVSGLHSDSFYFNNPEGEQEREAVRGQRVQESMAEFEEICILNGAKKVSSQHIHDEGVVQKTLSYISLDEKDKQKLMALDETHRLKFLESKFKDANIQSLSPQQKELLLDTIDKITLNIVPESQSEEKQAKDVRPLSTAAAISSANFQMQMEEQEEQSQNRGLKM